MTDLRHVDAVLDNLRRDAFSASEIVRYMTGARDAFAAAPDDSEVVHRLRMAELRMRADAAVLAHHFAALAVPAVG